MKLAFGVVSLLVVLVIVLLVAKQQTHAIASMPGASVAASGPNSGSGSNNVAEQSRRMQEQVANDVKKALEDGMSRNDRSDRGQVEDNK